MLLKATKNGLKYTMKTFNGKLKTTFYLFLCDKQTNRQEIFLSLEYCIIFYRFFS